MSQKFAFKRNAFIAVMMMLILSIVIKWQGADNHSFHNIQASYHTLLTVSAFKNNAFYSHLGLPSVTLDADRSDTFHWGETIPTRLGSYVYISFYTPAFAAVSAFFAVLNADINTTNLMIFNAFIGGLTFVCLFWLLCAIYSQRNRLILPNILVLLAISSIALFSREALVSTGIIYWAHSLYNLIFVLCLLSVYFYLKKSSRLLLIILCGLSYLGPLVEWSGYLFNTGLIICLVWLKKDIKLAVLVAVCSLFSLVTMLSHYIFATNFFAVVSALLSRWFSRSLAHAGMAELLAGYWCSYGIYLLVFIVAFARLLFRYHSVHPKLISENKLFLLCIAAFPLTENLLLMQHAVLFSFDRLKFIFLFALILLFYYSVFRCRKWLGMMLVICMVYGSVSYLVEVYQARHWNLVHQANIKIVRSLENKLDLNRYYLASDLPVRSYFNLLFQRDIKEQTDIYSEVWYYLTTAHRDYDGFVYVNASEQPNDLVTINSYAIFNQSDIREIASRVDVQKWFNDRFYLTDQHWVRGISRTKAGFFVPDTRKNRTLFQPGSMVRLGHGDLRIIRRAFTNGRHFNVYVDGDILNVNETGTPDKFEVVRHRFHMAN